VVEYLTHLLVMQQQAQQRKWCTVSLISVATVRCRLPTAERGATAVACIDSSWTCVTSISLLFTPHCMLGNYMRKTARTPGGFNIGSVAIYVSRYSVALTDESNTVVEPTAAASFSAFVAPVHSTGGLRLSLSLSLSVYVYVCVCVCLCCVCSP